MDNHTASDYADVVRLHVLQCVLLGDSKESASCSTNLDLIRPLAFLLHSYDVIYVLLGILRVFRWALAIIIVLPPMKNTLLAASLI